MAIIRVIIALSTAFVLAGCMHYASVDPGTSGLALQNQYLQSKIRTPVAGGKPTFRPINQAREAIRKARQAGVNAGKLSEAEQSLEKAQTSWQALDDPADPAPDRLAAIAHQAHRSERLAQIARFKFVAAKNHDRIEQLVAMQRGASAEAESRVLVPGRFGVIRFQEDTARVKSESRQVIQRVAKALNQPNVRARRIGIAGRTGPISPSKAEVASFLRVNSRIARKVSSAAEKQAVYKQALAITRARKVAKLLVQAGVEAGRIGTGISRPSDRIASRGGVVIEFLPSSASK